MNKASLYLRNSIQAQHDVIYVLDKYFKHLKPIENGTVLDVGCGPGNVTVESLLPLLPKTTKKVIGIDNVGELIEYAIKHFVADSRVSYKKMDIVADDVPLGYREAFDYIFSLYCFHFIADKRKAVENIFKMLKPGGNIFLIYMSTNNCLHQGYKEIYDKPEWKPYMGNFSTLISNEEFLEPPREYLQNIMTSAGFEVQTSTVEHRAMLHPVERILDLLTAMNYFDMTKQKEKEFALEFLSYVRKHNLVQFGETGDEMVNFVYELVVCHASKIEMTNFLE